MGIRAVCSTGSAPSRRYLRRRRFGPFDWLKAVLIKVEERRGRVLAYCRCRRADTFVNSSAHFRLFFGKASKNGAVAGGHHWRGDCWVGVGGVVASHVCSCSNPNP